MKDESFKLCRRGWLPVNGQKIYPRENATTYQFWCKDFFKTKQNHLGPATRLQVSVNSIIPSLKIPGNVWGSQQHLWRPQCNSKNLIENLDVLLLAQNVPRNWKTQKLPACDASNGKYPPTRKLHWHPYWFLNGSIFRFMQIYLVQWS